MNPTGWGCLSIALGLATLTFSLWRARRKLSGLKRFTTDFAGVLCVLLFLFAFMQWTSWYK